jgi:hypothetical protein
LPLWLHHKIEVKKLKLKTAYWNQFFLKSKNQTQIVNKIKNKLNKVERTSKTQEKIRKLRQDIKKSGHKKNKK